MPPLACITCGPAFEPLDGVRRITNFSTGEIGSMLAETFLKSGFDVVCFRGEAASFPAPAGVDVRTFTTNKSLADGLRSLERAPDVILHAAALCDFVLEKIDGSDGLSKFSSRSGSICLTLKPAKKVLPEMRGWFPEARIIGWKYELDGSREQAVSRGAAQIQETRTDACVINGSAYGTGFGLLLPEGSLAHFPDRSSLAFHLAGWMADQPKRPVI
ncbi:MAG: DNA/pantothenate metabolism flavoprotein domain protein [Verrucomicrobiaceae bacterium]|nr:MAG: DNA/pantothenate metabolism flavoprotein domain protein [Verrucomicrobiaceae bacterium]